MAETSRIRVKRLSLNETTDEGRYFAQVDRENVGVDGRAFWPTAAEAYRCGVRNLTAKLVA